MLLTVNKSNTEIVDAYLSRILGESETLESIEFAVWLIAALLFIWVLIMVLRDNIFRRKGDEAEPNWHAVIEAEYDKGNYESALETLATQELVFTKAASITYWQGRCYFQMEDWAKAAEKFEECVRREPPYRSAVLEYMAFIELNELVPGVEGYVDKL